MAGGAPVTSACELSQITKCSDVGASEPREQLEFRDSKTTADKAVVLWRRRCGLSGLAHRSGSYSKLRLRRNLNVCRRTMSFANAQCGTAGVAIRVRPLYAGGSLAPVHQGDEKRPTTSCFRPSVELSASTCLRDYVNGEWRSQSVGGTNGEREIAAQDMTVISS